MYLGIDLGTGSVKALLIDDDGRTVAEASQAYAVSSPVPGHAETAPADWWAGTVAAVRACCAGRGAAVRGIGLSGQAHGLVVLDDAEKPLRPAILWADQRATAEMDAVLALPEAVRRPLANPVVSGMAGLSLLWLRHNEPATYAAIRRILSPKDWLRLVLTGEVATEPSDASMTLLYEIDGDRWATDFLNALSLDPAVLAPVVESQSVAGRLTTAAAAELGLPAGTPVAAGLSDTASCLFGMGQTRPGSTILQVGSGIQIMSVVESIEPRVQPFYNSYRGIGRSLYSMAALQNGGTVFEWARTVLGASWAEMYRAGFDENEGNGGIVFLPYAAGERAPLLDPNAAAAWAYMRLGCTRGQLIRSVFEGVALAVRDSWDAMRGVGVSADRILLTGGGSTDPRWRQLLADILQMPLVPAHELGNATIGAAYLGGIAAGHWQGVEDIPFPDQLGETVEPRPFKGLDELLALFRATYRGLKQA
ncbi:xylulokinase [Shinella zoogloeoides]|uniref:xylulokinase n=3 Tax=Shinella TaxID=323620 RepID=UPI00299E332A|nr:FGGY family carbohydrate kinase [Shinella zoogloeoides]WPE21494.1 Xylulose kinase [Shinella zoogloeoides]